MYKRFAAVMFPVVALLLVGTVYWGYSEHRDKNAVLIKAENQYQRAFHDLSFHMNSLHDELGKALAVHANSKDYHRKCLVNVWRMTSQAQNEINQLPLTLLPFNKTEDFLAHVSSFSYRTGIRDLTKNPLTGDEVSTLKSLYDRSGELSKELDGIQAKVLNQHLRWMDVEMALAAKNSQHENSIIDGFKTVDKKISEYPEINWGPSVSGVFEQRSLKALNGKPVTKSQVRSIAAEYFGMKPDDLTVTENGKGTDSHSYSVAMDRGKNDRWDADFSYNGGELIWFEHQRPIPKENLDIAAAERAAHNYLQGHGYPGMRAVGADPYDHAVSITYASVKNNVIVYPEKLTVKVALDDGEVIGIQARQYLLNRKQRPSGKPKISSAEAREFLNPDLKVERSQLAVIRNEVKQEVLCYEYVGTINGQKYRIYLNADNGAEESVELIRGADGADQGKA